METKLYIYNRKTGELFPAEQPPRRLALSAEAPCFDEPLPRSQKSPSRKKKEPAHLQKPPSRREPKVVGRYRVKSISRLLHNVAAVGMVLIVTGMVAAVIWKGVSFCNSMRLKNNDSVTISTFASAERDSAAGGEQDYAVSSERDSTEEAKRESTRRILAEKRQLSVADEADSPLQETAEIQELGLTAQTDASAQQGQDLPAHSNASAQGQQGESGGVREKLEAAKAASFDPNAELPLINGQYVTREMALAFGFSEEFMTEERCKEYNETLIKDGINTPNKIANFTGQGLVETGMDNWEMPKNGGKDKYYQAGFIHVSLESNFKYLAERLNDPEIHSKGEPYVTENYFFESAGDWWSWPWNRMNERIDEGATIAEVTKILTGDKGDPNMQRREDATNRVLGVFENYYNMNHMIQLSAPTLPGP